MDCVARGELAPTVVQDMAPAFIQARGPAYTSKLAETSSRFFSGMVQIDASASHDLVNIILPGGEPAPPLQPPEFDTTDPIRWYQQLTEYARQLTAKGMLTYQALLERVAAGEVAPSQVQAASSDYLERRLPEHLNRLGSLYFDLLNSLNNLRADYEEDFLSGVLATAQRPGQQTPAALNLVAPLGGTTSTSLVLTNTRAEPAIIHCTVTDVRRADGVGAAFVPKIVIAPDGLKIPPGGQATFVLSLRLDARDYDPDVLYVGAVHIEREGEPRLEMPLRITATPAAPTAAPARKRKTPKSKTTKRTTAKNKPSKGKK